MMLGTNSRLIGLGGGFWLGALFGRGRCDCTYANLDGHSYRESNRPSSPHEATTVSNTFVITCYKPFSQYWSHVDG